MKKPRIPNGMSQTALAERIGCAPRSINEICNGKGAISPLMAMRLADVFG
jgi:plasmid maintenance system antidote protein VapI